MYWYENGGKNNTVLSTRVRFARNLSGLRFPECADEKTLNEVCETAKKAFSGYECFDFSKLNATEKTAYAETHLCSPQFASGEGKGRLLLISPDGEVSVMVNEEDHFRIQAICPGLDTARAFEKALAADDLLPQERVAFDEKLGYLTACPTNLGCAMRVSAMLHLPALAAAGEINGLSRAVDQLGFTLRGAFGEGSGGVGDLYQVSNRGSYDSGEKDVIKAFEKLVGQICEREGKLRDAMKKDGISLEDRVWRSFGTLNYARSLSYSEFVGCWSDLRLGAELGMEGAPDTALLDRLLIELMPARLCLKDMEASDPVKRDAIRARTLREALK